MRQDDLLRIEGLKAEARVGVPPLERRRRQRVLIDLELGLNLQSAGQSDQVKKTVDYAQVCRRVKEKLKARTFRLVEAMAESVAREILKEFRVNRVRVRIRKFSVPGTRSVGVEIERGQTPC